MVGRVLRRYAPLLPLSVGLIMHSRVFAFVSDDAYISFVYSRNLAEHGQLVFNLGDRVEGYTNFLWTLLLGLLMKLGAPPPAMALVLGAAFGVATLVVTVRLTAVAAGGESAWDYLPAAFLAASSGFACWCSGGLETQMFTFFVALGVLWYLEDAPGRSGLALAAAALTRPEGVLVFAVVALHRVATRGVRRLLPERADLVAAGAFLAVWAPYFAWRWWYYGWPFPNTFYVKTGTAANPHLAREVLSNGAFYAWQWATQSKALWAAPFALLAVFFARRFAGLAILLSAVYLPYVIRIGGDFMGLHRFVMPLFVTTAILAMLGLKGAVGLLPARARRAGAIVACIAVLVPFGASQAALTRTSLVPVADHGIDRPGYLALYSHDRELMGKALAPHVGPDDFAIFGGVGVLPYYSHLAGFDVFGLVSTRIAHEVPPTNARPGHQKWAPASMLLAAAPTLLLHCYDLHRAPDSYHLCGEAAFFETRGYEPVTLHVPGLRERGEYFTFLRRKDRPWP